MSVRDIIERVDREDWGEEWVDACGHEASVVRFIATFDPEHVALMEAVVEGLEGASNYDLENPKSDLWRAMDALTAYRKERGLS